MTMPRKITNASNFQLCVYLVCICLNYAIIAALSTVSKSLYIYAMTSGTFSLFSNGSIE
jgi:hypothetical protein